MLKNWLKISLCMILVGIILMTVSFGMAGFKSQPFQYRGTHEWSRTFNF
ncbi:MULTISPECIES: hypothetical protein [Latilactobacillus]|uniref:Uncharacterized protein n=1 Tax=Latilactobacillus curvatus TaxID=28038 RepID=A0AAJ5UPH6_LATCU|nr:MULTISPECIES: hypothetical protein [Latilactobacillus]MDT3393777.1 hypothetical protein [Bacillota bacterium]EHE86004.1 hypothetical protein CRL705_880 [Latilactobacillus curvatus CRL 705]MBZ1504822.1 hypothetical protein [Latilactobacillus curvatus]MCM0724429.1 hypothetical protein [Latilactobacillus curvatus]MCM6843291.1 hypothetical protein [Latilactobacillus curvatus]